MASAKKQSDTAKSAESGNLPAINNEASANVPAFMKDDARDGKENIDQSDIIIPRVALMQAISPEVVEGHAKSGEFYHTINEESVGSEMDLVFVHHSKRYTLWLPRHAGGGIIARATDGAHWDSDFEVEFAPYKDRPKYKVTYSAKKGDPVGRDAGLGKWGTLDPENEDSGPAATLSHQFVAVDLNNPDLGAFVVFLQRSAEPVAKQLLSKIKLAKAPLYGQVFRMGSKDAQNASGDDYKQYTFAKNGFVQDAETYETLKRMNDEFRSLDFRTNEEAPDTTADTDAGDAGEGEKSSADDKY